MSSSSNSSVQLYASSSGNPRHAALHHAAQNRAGPWRDQGLDSAKLWPRHTRKSPDTRKSQERTWGPTVANRKPWRKMCIERKSVTYAKGTEQIWT